MNDRKIIKINSIDIFMTSVRFVRSCDKHRVYKTNAAYRKRQFAESVLAN